MAERVRTKSRALERAGRKQKFKSDRKALNEKIERIKRLRSDYDRAHRNLLTIPAGFSVPDLRKVMPGDIFASIDTGSAFSRSVAKAINSPYSHVGVFMDRTSNGELRVKDFRVGRKDAVRPFTEAHKDGVNYVVLRWVPVSPKQIESFRKNIEKISGKYDVPLAIAYGVEVQLKRLFGIKVNLKWDIEKWWTCSEQVSHAGDPSPKMLASGVFFPVEPPLKPNPKMNRNNVTPKTIAIDGVNHRALKVITLRKLF